MKAETRARALVSGKGANPPTDEARRNEGEYMEVNKQKLIAFNEARDALKKAEEELGTKGFISLDQSGDWESHTDFFEEEDQFKVGDLIKVYESGENATIAQITYYDFDNEELEFYGVS